MPTELIPITTAERVFPDTDEGRIDRKFDAYDGKGRQFGAMVRKFTCSWRKTTVNLWNYPSNIESAKARACLAGRTQYGFRPHATRNGSLYGASNADRLFDTAAERDAAVDMNRTDGGAS